MCRIAASTFLLLSLICGRCEAQLPARTPSLDTAPTPKDKATHYTDYLPQPHERVMADVTSACRNGACVSRLLLMISRNGDSKNFETISGQDGLTCGIKDFATNGGILNFMRSVRARHPAEFAEAFGIHQDDVVSPKWIEENNAGGKGAHANDRGLIRFDWLRHGLDKLLANPKIRITQLDAFQEETVRPSLEVFQANKFQHEFTLAAMVGVANSMGIGGMKKLLKSAKAGSSGDDITIGKALLKKYIQRDPHPGGKDSDLIQRMLQSSPEPDSESELGHRGRRAHWTLKLFPPASGSAFTEIGSFEPN